MIISGQSSNLLNNSEISHVDKRTIGTIARNSVNLSKLTRQIIETTKNDNWQLKLDIKKFYLYEIINPIINEYTVLAKEKDIQLDFSLNNLQEVFLTSDSNKLQVIINNMLSNAIRYSKHGGAIIMTCSDNHDTLFIAVEDNGIGILEYELDKIFNRFYQGSSFYHSDNPNGGFGIGLSTCKEYAVLLGGNITVKSKAGEGSTFYLEIPKYMATIENNYQELNLKPVDSDNLEVPNKVFVSDTKSNILIVEDNKDIWLYFQNILSKEYNLDFASNGKEALTFLNENKTPNLIITDIMMPVMNGFEFIENLKSNQDFNFIPTLVVTARFDIRDKIMSLSLNLDDYIIKPFNDKLFLARIKYLIDLSQNHFEDIINHKKNKTIISQKDKEWLAKIEALVRESLSDVNLTPTLLAEKINLSQVHMDRKLKTLIGFTTSKYILEARLRIALEIIEKKEVTLVKEVCFMVGFKSPRSFSRSFKQRFGMFPSELINK